MVWRHICKADCVLGEMKDKGEFLPDSSTGNSCFVGKKQVHAPSTPELWGLQASCGLNDSGDADDYQDRSRHHR